MTIRLPVELRDRFLEVCKEKDLSGARVIRQGMRDFIESNAQAALPLGDAPKRKGRKP